MSAADLSNQRFGRLTVVERTGTDQHRNALWRARCDCGADRIVAAPSLLSGNSRSCGCLQKDVTIARSIKHGLARRGKQHGTYTSWAGMVQRCTNPNDEDFAEYGGRGVQLCEEWRSFDGFLASMGMRPSDKHSIDRYPNNDGNYEPGNCRWATAKEQANNRRAPRKAFRPAPTGERVVIDDDGSIVSVENYTPATWGA